MSYFSSKKRSFLPLYLLLPILFFLAILLLGSLAQREQKAISQQVLRLHIIGQSNQEDDQALKLLVRDRILAEHKDIFAQARGRDDAILQAGLILPQIKTTAEQALQKHGCNAPVTVRLEETVFPTKQYGAISLPAGKYTSVNVRIGDAEGENWWCVLYPPLCLTEGTVQAEEQTITLLKETLDPEEYALITQPDKITFRVKFKLLEILKKIGS